MFQKIFSIFGRSARRAICLTWKYPKPSGKSKRRPLGAVPLRIEALEDRAVPAGIVMEASTFDVDHFEQNIVDVIDGNVVGYGYAITQNGSIVRHDGDGDARTTVDGQKDYHSTTRQEIASVSKTITAVAVLKILQDQNMSVDTAIGDYLPSAWTVPEAVQAITFRQLLTHTSGFRTYALNYNSVQAVVEGGLEGSQTFSYLTTNYSILRVAIPYLQEDVSNDFLDAFPLGGTTTAVFYKSYVIDNVLDPAGVYNPDTKPAAGETDPTLIYAWPDVGASGTNTGNQTANAGGRGWRLSAYNLGEFLTALRTNDNILTPATRDLMDQNFFGWSNPANYTFAQGFYGTYYSHGGDNFGGVNTAIMDFPNGVQAALVMNSNTAAGIPYQAIVLKDAFEDAWTDVVIEGDSGPNTFVVRQTGGEIEVLLDGATILQQTVGTLDSLTLNGLGGNDTFLVEDVHSSLEVILNGGSGSDTFEVGDDWFDINIDGDVDVNGGSGTDTLVVTDSNNVGDDTYFVWETTIDKSNYNGLFEYSNVETVDVEGGQGNEYYYLLGSATGTDVILRGGTGNDQFHVGGMDISDNIGGIVDVDGEAGSDDLYFHDQWGSGTNDSYVLQTDYFLKTGFGGIVNHEAVEAVTLNASTHDNTIHVRNTRNFSDLTINANAGEDDILVHDTGTGSDVHINGGSGDDTVELTPEDDAQDLDAIGGEVIVDGGTGTDSVAIYDQLDLYGDTYTIESDYFDKTNFDRLEYVAVEDLELHANDADNTVQIDGLAIGTSWSVYTGLGDDTVQVGQATDDLDTDLNGDLALYGGGFGLLDEEVDTLIFYDGSDFGNDIYELGSSSFTKSFELGGFRYSLLNDWYYSGFEDLTINANAYDNAFEISALLNFHRTMPVTINAFSGDDELVLGSASNRIDLIREPIHFNGATGTDTITAHDEDSPTGRTYTLVSQTFDVSGNFSSLSYTSVSTFEVSAGAHNDTFDVQSSVLSTDLILNGGNGSDTFELAGGTHDLDSIGGHVTVNGGGGFGDTILLQDDLDGGADEYVVEGSFGGGDITKTTFDLHYSSAESIVLNANNHDNDIRVESLGVLTSLDVYANGGDDDILLSPTALNLGTLDWYMDVDGGDGFDEMFLYDQNSGVTGPYWVTDSNASRQGWLGTDYVDLERLSWQLNAEANTFNVLSTQPGTNMYVNGRQGDDVFNVTAPSSYVTLFGSSGVDTLNYTATDGNDEIELGGNLIFLATGAVSTGSVEQRNLDAGAGADVAIVDGVDGVVETFHIQASSVAGSGTFSSGLYTPVDFQNLEMFDVEGDAGDEDELAFTGTASADHFDIHLDAAGTTKDPVMRLQSTGRGMPLLLTLRDFSNVGVPTVNGVGGNDDFEVDISPTISRDVHVDGGIGNDSLELTYVATGADLDWLVFPGDPEDGIIQVNYGVPISTVGYEDFEDVDVTSV